MDASPDCEPPAGAVVTVDAMDLLRVLRALNASDGALQRIRRELAFDIRGDL